MLLPISIKEIHEIDLLYCVLVLDAVGFWPLNEEYEGRDYMNKTDMELTGVQFSSDTENIWSSPPAHFLGSSDSYGYLPTTEHFNLRKSFSWMTAIKQDSDKDGPLFNINYVDDSGSYGPVIWMHQNGAISNTLHLHLWYPTCQNEMFFSGAVSINTWHTLAMSFDYESKKMSWWVDGQLDEKQFGACDEEIICGDNVGIGKW